MANYTDFGLQARTIMLQEDITMTAIAEHLGVSVSYISDIFRGARKGTGQKEKIMEFLQNRKDDKNAVSR